MNHSKHIWLRWGTVLPPAAVESGVSQNESAAAAEPQARGRKVRVRITHFQSAGCGLRGLGAGAAGTQLSGFLK